MDNDIDMYFCEGPKQVTNEAEADAKATPEKATPEDAQQVSDSIPQVMLSCADYIMVFS